MKHLRSFKTASIEQICEDYRIINYTINPDGTVDVDGDVNLFNMLTKLPVKFGKVHGGFYCANNYLISLEGCPYEVGGDFNCHGNQLTSLDGCPSYICDGFDCSNNHLSSLKGGPKEVGGDFYCGNNGLKTLEGGPTEVGGDFCCSYNQLETLEGGPIEVGGDFYCDHNLISPIYNLFGSYKKYQDSLDYNYLRGTNIIKSRFEEALEEIGKTLPKNLASLDYRGKGYNYI